jgi:serine/threonine-protein kinase
VRSNFAQECARLKLELADQIERQALREARQTVIALLCLDPTDLDALNARALIDEQLAVAPPHPVGEVQSLASHKNWVNCVVYSPDGRFALSGGGGDAQAGVRGGLDRSIRLWEVETGREVRRYLGRLGMVTGIAFAADGKRAVSSNLGGGVHLWDVETGDNIRRFDPSVSQVHCVAMSPDDRWVLAGGEDRVIHHWDAATGARIRRLSGHTQTIASVAFSPDARHILSGSSDQSVRLWDASNGALLRIFAGHTQPVLGVAVSNDGRQALSCGSDGTVRLWDCESGRELACLIGHQGPVNAVAFSPDGQRALSGGADGVLRLWDLASGRELKCFQGHRDQVTSVACSPEGNYALSGGRDATVRLWQLPIASVSSVSTEAHELMNNLPFSSVGSLIDELHRARILDPAQEAALTHAMRARFASPKALVQHLIESGWLTTYQVGQLAERRGGELRLGEYVLREALGEGGMGQVFKARKFGTPQDVALKIVLPELTSDREALQQFQWEIRALAQMSHPNIIKTYDAGQDGDRHFFTMEYVEGIDLYQLMRRFGPLPLERAVDYVRQAALGLEHAHEHCLIHRDIKPANLFLTFPPGEAAAEGGKLPEAVVKVLDWGLAGLRLPKGRQAAVIRSPREENVGTADYISPEQATNSTGADIRTDIYSLGCTLYHLLAGAPPFPGKSVMQKLLKHQKEEPLPIQVPRPDVPDHIAQVIHKMMAKRPEDRYPAPAVVAVALTLKR